MCAYSISAHHSTYCYYLQSAMSVLRAGTWLCTQMCSTAEAQMICTQPARADWLVLCTHLNLSFHMTNACSMQSRVLL